MKLQQRFAGHSGLQGRLDALVSTAPARLMLQHRKVLNRNVHRLHASRAEDSVLRSGERATDFALVNQHGRVVRLGDRLAQGPVVLIFYRGPWCPYCEETLRSWQAQLAPLHDAGGSLLAISPQTPEFCAVTARSEGLSYDLLSDLGCEIAGGFRLLHRVVPEVQTVYRQIGIELTEYNGDDGTRLPMAATFLIDRTFEIRLSDVHSDPSQRLDPDEVISSLRRLNDR